MPPVSSQAELFASSRHDIGADGDAAAFLAETTVELRRSQGITFTPAWLIERMLDRAEALGSFDTIVDAGAGTGRFALAAARRFPRAHVLAIEPNEQLVAILRQRIQACGLGSRVSVIAQDYRAAELPLRGRALFIGNPPYVRHHDIDAEWKRWYSRTMAGYRIKASQLAGLHAHFLLRSHQLMRAGDAMCVVTAAEWLDNGYGAALRDLLTGRAEAVLKSLWLAVPDEPVFPDALVSAVVLEAGHGDAGGVELGRLSSQCFVSTRRMSVVELRVRSRWSELCQPGPGATVAGIELGDFFRVTRGQVTGMNEAWVLPVDAPQALRELGVPAVTRAREIIDGTVVAADARTRLRFVVDLPDDIEQLCGAQREVASQFMERAHRLGAHRSYVARQRKSWYAVGMRQPPAAFVSYMGRRPPVFVPNPNQVSFLNIAHGLYPRLPISTATLKRMLDHLNAHTDLYSGRVYGGGLAKFEPSDVARLRLPASILPGSA